MILSKERKIEKKKLGWGKKKGCVWEEGEQGKGNELRGIEKGEAEVMESREKRVKEREKGAEEKEEEKEGW